jgi:thymidylate synthase (FAD)
MKVTLISTTPDAAEILLFTKETRLGLTPGLLDEIRGWSREKKLEGLKYMAGTIPSSWEFCAYTFLIEGVSRAYTHQQVRSRHGSYAQQSMRVVGMGDFDYVPTDRNVEDPRATEIIAAVLRVIKQGYGELISIGQAPEDARGILPTNISTNIVCGFNLRTMSELARSRTGGRTQGEYQRVINALLDAVLEVHPWASEFFFPKGRDYFAEIEAFALREWPNDLVKRGELLKIVDQMRKAA